MRLSIRISLRSLVLLALAGSGLLLGESTARAQLPRYAPAYGPPPGYRRAPVYAVPYYGYHTHDGFFMRLNAGFGFMTASETYAGATDTYSGPGVTVGAAFGGVVAPNLIVFGELLATDIQDPDFEVSGVPGSTALNGMDVAMGSIGPGIAYYFMPINLYLSATLTFTRISFSDSTPNHASGDTNAGIGLSLMVGKEWWVGWDWGIGVAGQLHIASMRDHPSGYDARMGATVFSILFSATYN
jgi:hypothetical protein